MVRAGVGRYDACLADPSHCDEGFSFSIFEKVDFNPDVFETEKQQSDKYIFSTGGGYTR